MEMLEEYLAFEQLKRALSMGKPTNSTVKGWAKQHKTWQSISFHMDGAITDWLTTLIYMLFYQDFFFLLKKGVIRARLELEPDRWRSFPAAHVLPF